MKFLFRTILFYSIALFVASQIFPAIALREGLSPILTAGTLLALLTMFIKPILSILFLPLNFLTLGLANWLIGAILLYILTVLTPNVSVRAWNFPGVSSGGFAIPAIGFSYLISLIIASLFLNFLVKVFEQVTD